MSLDERDRRAFAETRYFPELLGLTSSSTERTSRSTTSEPTAGVGQNPNRNIQGECSHIPVSHELDRRTADAQG